jgi:YidC/Oxa1 family membrane protein insertase
MKRNWGLAAVIFAFIILYQVFVLGPQSKKAAEAYKARQAEIAKTLTPTPPPAATSGAKPEDITKTLPPSTPNATNEAPLSVETITFDLGAKRTVEITSNGVVKSGTLTDWKTPKVILTKGLHLSSTNEKVLGCLKGLQMVESSGQARLVGKFQNGSCELIYRTDPQHRSLLHATLNLKGYEAETGEIFLQFKGSLDSKEAQDQNFLSYQLDGSKKDLRAGGVFKTLRAGGNLDWLAWGDRYFSTIFIPKGKYMPAVFVEGQEADVKNPDSTALFGVSYPLNPEKLTNGFTYEYSLYLGTRDPQVLEEISPVLVKSVDLGFFASIARLMLWALKAFYKVFGNYGWSIVALTILVRGLFWPLNRKAYISSLAMKNIQPEVTRLKEKYGKEAKNAAAMNSELMQLYKKNKVNPLGGCLPILLQIPIFIGLYGALNHSIDLYGAPFFGWITNLSAKDPFYVFPALWTASLLGYMQLNPQTMNPQPGMPDMKWMFIGMNIFFGYLSANWPSGLTLYLFVSNVVGITQQILIRRSSKKFEMIQEGA